MDNKNEVPQTRDGWKELMKEALREVLAEQTGENREGYIDTVAAADILNIKVSTLYNYINKGTVPFHKKNGSKKVLFKASELTAWMETNKTTGGYQNDN